VNGRETVTGSQMKVALAGDTMLGRGIAEALASSPAEALVSDQLVDVVSEADLFLLNLECCISERGEPWRDPAKPFFFRAPPAAVELLSYLGVDCVTLANNHALDFGPPALLDTLDHLRAAGIACVGAGSNEAEAHGPALLDGGGISLAVFGVADHPREYAARPDSPGIAFASLDGALPGWLDIGIRTVEADAVLVTPHWGPNMVPGPIRRVRKIAAALLDAGATLVAGHSAHVFHGVSDRVLYDLGDLLDDYRVDPTLRNDLGLLFLVTLAESGPSRVEAVPLKLEYCHTRLASGAEAVWIGTRLRRACAALGTEVAEIDGRFVVYARSSG
jgi:poly-gamma-glutamate capsule biosynthesis protein CapA/YwtB (metallophosphatase superfamily)